MPKKIKKKKLLQQVLIWTMTSLVPLKIVMMLNQLLQRPNNQKLRLKHQLKKPKLPKEITAKAKRNGKMAIIKEVIEEVEVEVEEKEVEEAEAEVEEEEVVEVETQMSTMKASKQSLMNQTEEEVEEEVAEAEEVIEEEVEEREEIEVVDQTLHQDKSKQVERKLELEEADLKAQESMLMLMMPRKKNELSKGHITIQPSYELL